jgi:hypothetical protein
MRSVIEAVVTSAWSGACWGAEAHADCKDEIDGAIVVPFGWCWMLP